MLCEHGCLVTPFSTGPDDAEVPATEGGKLLEKHELHGWIIGGFDLLSLLDGDFTQGDAVDSKEAEVMTPTQDDTGELV